MDSTHHDSKDWHISQASLQNSCLAESPSQPPQMQPYPPMPSMEHPYAHPYQAVMHPPVHHPLPSNSYLPPGKNDSDPRLPGMMAISQPGTPRPTHSPSHHAATTSPIIKKDPTKYTAAPTSSPSSFHSSAVSPYAHAALARKRGGRNELFSTELGPFFSSTKPFDNLYALDRSTLLTTRIQAKMDRGFFLADNDWTCYRRNYFQVSGAFSIHGLTHHPNPYYADHHQHPQCLVQVDGQFHAVHNFYMSISARVSNSDKKIELVQHTPKRDKGPQTTPAPKPIVPGGNLNMSSVGANQSIVTFERIQFKTATANNGKRRAAQQYYVCLVDLYAEIEDTKQQVKVASCQSAPLVVRGRSPGHYSDNTNGEQHRYETGSHDDGNRFSAPPPPFSSRAPPPHLTSPGVMGPEYGSPYYQPYSNYSHFSPMQPPPPPPQQQHQMPHGMMMGSAPPTPTHLPPSHSLPPPPNTNGGPYMVPSMTTSDPSSSETSSPDLYNNNNNNNNTNDDTKLNQNGMNIHMHHVDNSNNDWSHRSRMNSVGSSHGQSPATPYENQHQHSYFNNSNNSNNNNTYTVSSYDHRKYSNSGASLQQQTS